MTMSNESTNRCPDSAALARYLGGELAPGEIGIMEGHFSDCLECRSNLERLSDDDSIFEHLRRKNGDGYGDESAVERLQDAVAGMASTDEGYSTNIQSLRGWNRYKIKQKLGSGRFGEVFLAYDSKMGREVALKRYRTNGRVSPSVIRNSAEEAKTLWSRPARVYRDRL